MLRRLAERVARGVVFKRRLPARFGRVPLYVTPDSALQYLKPKLDADFANLFDIVDEFVQPGDCVWDLGANVGMFTFAAAQRAGAEGHVVAVEADVWLATLIQRSALIPENAGINVSVLPAALSDRCGIERFLIANRGRSANSLERAGHRSQAKGTRFVNYVPCLTLDQLLETFPPPQFIKIDVEGAELMLLSQAKKVLTQCRPRLYCEVGGQQNERVTELLRNHDYTLFDGDVRDRQPLAKCAWNSLAVPNELLESSDYYAKSA
jgi:FkbM family methyltransferase